MRKIIIFLLSALFAISSAACGDSAAPGKTAYNSPESEDIHIGISYPAALMDGDTYFRKGVELAVNTVNNNGGVLGKTLKTVIRDDQNDANIAMQIAETFYEQGITAVVGHWGTNICYFVEDIYEENKVVMLMPAATGTNLFETDYRYVYRMIADNRFFAEVLAEHMASAGLTRIAVYYSDDEYGSDFSAIVEKELAKRQIDVIDRVTSITAVNAKTVMERWQAFGCDGVLMAAVPPEIIEPIRLIRDSDRKLPIFGADNFDRTTFIDAMSRDSGGIYIASFQMESLDTAFLEAFRASYGHNPDTHALSGYEAVFLLRDAIQAAGTTDGTAIAEYLSGLKDYKTVSGIRSYNPETQELDGYAATVRKLIPD